jgi:hypothetical protein
MSDPLDLDLLEALERAATPVDLDKLSAWIADIAASNSSEPNDDDGYDCARCGQSMYVGDGLEPTLMCHGCAHEFVADALRALPALIAELRASRRVVDAARACRKAQARAALHRARGPHTDRGDIQRGVALHGAVWDAQQALDAALASAGAKGDAR